MTFRQVPRKILKGDFSFLVGSDKKKKVHPAVLGKMLSEMPMRDALKTLREFPKTEQTEIFPYIDKLLQQNLIQIMPSDEAKFILNALSSDDIITLFSGLKGVERSALIEFLNETKKDETEDFLGYNENSVARLVNTDFATISKEMSVGEAMEHLRKNHTDSDIANMIYVVDEQGVLIDDIPVRRFILNDPSKKVADIMDGFFVKLDINDTKQTAVEKFKEYDRVVLPVTDEHNILLGVVTVDDVLDVVEQKDTEDIQKFGGLEALDYPYVNTSVRSLIQKRAGWLIILFLSEMLTATAMGYFDTEIAKAVVLALFVPLVISSGGNSGSQAATLIIRALALKELTLRDWWFVMRREIISGFTLGIILGTIGFIRISLWQKFGWYDYGIHWELLAITIFFSLIGIVMWGTLSGSMIPIVLKRFGFDPAASSAPFVATLVDVTGLVIYFTIAAIILKGTLL